MEGPDQNRRAFDLTGWFARTGILDMMHEKDIAPAMPAGDVGDHATTMTLFAGIVTALYKRDRSGEGSMVSTSLVATGSWANGLNLQGVIAGVDIAARRDQEGFSNPMQNVYTSADGRHILVAVQNIPRDWPKLVEVLEHPEWLEDEKLQPVKPMFRNRFYAKAKIAAAFAELPADEVCARLDAAGIVFSLSYRNAEVLQDEQLRANHVLVPSDGELPGNERTFATPIGISDETQVAPSRAPNVGEHTTQVLLEYGLDHSTIQALIDNGVIAQASANSE